MKIILFLKYEKVHLENKYISDFEIIESTVNAYKLFFN